MLLSFAGALGAASVLTGFQAPEIGFEQLDAQVAEAQGAAAESGAAEAGWIDVGLLAGAGIFFLISAVRLMRRTQGFWTWLIGFALYGGRWAMAQQGDLIQTVRGIDPNAYLQPQVLVGDPAAVEAQVGLLGVILVVGLLVFIIDAADRAHWDRQGA
jgi:hypothetical protein